MTKNNPNTWVGEQYADEFEKKVNVVDFSLHLLNLAKGFALNLLNQRHSKKRPIYVWIEMFLDWIEYNEYMEYRKSKS